MWLLRSALGQILASRLRPNPDAAKNFGALYGKSKESERA
jgi:hypothetical protein